jgi:aryl-alcohol dehydrogenase (NADP+)
MFGGVGNPGHEESVRMVHRALGAGTKFADKAAVSSQGESEVIVRKALRGRGTNDGRRGTLPTGLC